MEVESGKLKAESGKRKNKGFSWFPSSGLGTFSSREPLVFGLPGAGLQRAGAKRGEEASVPKLELGNEEKAESGKT